MNEEKYKNLLIKAAKKIRFLEAKVDRLQAELNTINSRKTKYLTLTPCTCGSTRRNIITRKDGTFYRCCSCGKESAPAKTKKQIKLNWNNMIELERERINEKLL